MGICIQQPCMWNVSKSEKSVGYLDTNNQVEEVSGCIFKENESEAYWLTKSQLYHTLEILTDYKVSHNLT